MVLRWLQSETEIRKTLMCRCQRAHFLSVRCVSLSCQLSARKRRQMMLCINWRPLLTVRRLSEHITILCWYFFLTFPEQMHKKKKKSPTAGLEMCRGQYTVGLIMEPPSSRPLTPQSAGCLHYLPSVWHDVETSDKKAPPQMNRLAFQLFSF